MTREVFVIKMYIERLRDRNAGVLARDEIESEGTIGERC